MDRLRIDQDTNKVEEVPAREPKLFAKPIKSALKKKGFLSVGTVGSGTSTPTQEAGKSVGIKSETSK